MKKTLNILFLTVAAFAAAVFFQSCDRSKDPVLLSALVTYEDSESGVRMQLDDNTSLVPTNIKPGMYGNKTVRALIRYFEDDSNPVGEGIFVKVATVDTIRTKPASVDKGELNDSYYGKDRLEIVRDWTTIGEDGYLTLLICTHRGDPLKVHTISLVSKGEKDGVYEFELHHDADGDIYGYESEGLIAFNLNDLAPEDRSPIILRLSWDGFYEHHSADFKLTFRKK